MDQIRDPHGPVDEPAFLVPRDDLLFLVLPVFVADLADQLLEDVLESHHPIGAAVFVEHDGQLRLLLLERLQQPLDRLTQRLAKRLEDDAEELDTPTRLRIEAMVRGLKRRSAVEVAGWRSMLQTLNQETPPEFVDWFAVERIDGRDIDIGMHRHWIDPTIPFAGAVAVPAHGLLITSATLTDGSGDVESDWGAAEARTGARHLPNAAVRAQVASPFDYPRQTRVYVVTDVRKDDLDQVAAAYRVLFLAAGGLGMTVGAVYTAKSRVLSRVKKVVQCLHEDEG